MSCPELLRTQAFLDGEVDGPAADAAERHIETCAECQAFCEHAATVSDAIRATATRHAAPVTLKRRVSALLDEAERESAHRPDRPADLARAGRRGFWRGAAGGAGLTALAASLALVMLQPPSGATLAEQVTDAHTRALMNGRAITVASSDHHTVKPWFAGRIAISPPVRDFAGDGFKLTGGRLDRVGGAPAAVLTYQHGKHEIDLFVWADRGWKLPEGAVRHGYHLTFWRSGDLAFAAVSDTAPEELARFVRLVRSQPE